MTITDQSEAEIIKELKDYVLSDSNQMDDVVADVCSDEDMHEIVSAFMTEPECASNLMQTLINSYVTAAAKKMDRSVLRGES